MVFRLSMSDDKSPQVSRTHLHILTDLSTVVVWVVSAYPPISNSSSLLSKSFDAVPSAPITLDIIIINIIILIILLFWEFFTPALADGLSQESVW